MVNLENSKSAFDIIGSNLEIGSSHDYKKEVFRISRKARN